VAFDAGPGNTVDEMVGAAGPGYSSYDDSALGSPAFRVLRSTVGNWIGEITRRQNHLADQQISHFYR